MKKSSKDNSLLEQNSFLKGLMIGIGSTVVLAGIGAAIAHQIIQFKRERDAYDKKMYNFSLEGNIIPDSCIAETNNPMFVSESEQLERDFEIRQKEFEEIEEASKNLRDKM